MNTSSFWIQGCPPAKGAVAKVVSFGDSLSDTGFSDGHGFGRYSNGPTWVEYLTQGLGADLVCRAWGGARTDQGNCSGPKDWSGLAWQIEQHDFAADPEATLYTVLIGVNDLYDGKGDPLATAARIVEGHDRLRDKGARTVLMCSVPNLGRAPAYRTQQEYQGLAPTIREHTRLANEALLPRLAERPCLVFDVLGFWDHLLDHVYRTTDRSWLWSYLFPEADGYFWWDEWHPMTSVHQRLAAAVGGWAGPVGTAETAESE